MWVYQETKTNAAALVPTLPEDTAGESLAEKEAMTPVSKPLAELPPQKASRRKPFQASRDCILLAAAYLFGTLMAGVLQALCDAEEMETLAYYLDCWRGVFAASSTAQAVGLFGAELAVVLGAAAVFLLLGLSAVGPLPIFLFAMLYGTGSGLLSAQLLDGLGAKQLILFLLTASLPTALAAGALCLFSWNTMNEDVVAEAPKAGLSGGKAAAPARQEGVTSLTARRLADISTTEEKSRILTGISELDRVLGGGIVLGGVVLLSGEPGVGKSTMLLQLCGAISNQHTVLYITGEESVRQVKLRAARLKVPQDNIYLAAENDVDEICGLIEKEKPELVVIDSIQTMRCMDISSSSGTVSQVKESAARLLAVAKKQEIPMFIVGHVNKDGAIAGPKVMEHIVDTVLYFEGDKMLPYRILRAAKNRYGSTNELGMFDMTGQGLEEIENPSQMLLEGRPLGVSGNCVACTMEGSRPILSEIQALATKTNFPAPRRACSGYDYNRMNLLIAVLEKRAGYFFGNLDVYINIVSGITLRDTACDLAVCLSMVSSLLDCPVSDKLIAIGEVGLGGEVRSVPNLEQRLREAERIGFERAVVPKHSLAHLNAADYPGMKLVGAAYISDAIHALKSDRL